MEMLLYIVVGFILGSLLGYFILKSRQSGSFVSKQELENVQQEIVREQEQKKLALQRFDQVNEQLIQLRQKLEQVQIESAGFAENIRHKDLLLDQKTSEFQTAVTQKNQLQDKLLDLERANADLLVRNSTLTEKLSTFKEELTREFTILSQRILEEKSARFTELNKSQMDQVLKPFEKEIKEFKEKVETAYQNESKERHSLQNELKKLLDLNQRLSDEARSLTKALTIDTKTQGEFGEMILEKILEQSGLTRDREFSVQEGMQDAEGNRLRTDVIVKLPDNRNIIIDSKMSLTDYDRYMRSEEAEEQQRSLQQHLKSIRQHIDLLHKKNYTDYPGSPEFIFMFVPIEPALMLALQHDQEIWSYAYSRGIILVGPTNLFAALKLISEIWKKERQSRHAIEIAERAGALYDKFAGFMDSMTDIGRHIEKANDSYQKAYNQLKDGKGNIVTRVEQLRLLGAKNKRQIDTQLFSDEALLLDDDEK